MERTKRVKCESCCGKGMIIPKKHGGMVVPRKCEHCNGTGTIEAQITNADRIRAMSDEELADWLARTQIANVAEALKIAKISYEQEDGLKDEVKKECLEWLKQPAE